MSFKDSQLSTLTVGSVREALRLPLLIRLSTW